MPKVPDFYKPKPQPPEELPIDHWHDLCSRYKLAHGITLEDMGSQLGESKQAARYLLTRPAETLRISDVLDLCRVLQMPVPAAFRAIQQTVCNKE